MPEADSENAPKLDRWCAPALLVTEKGRYLMQRRDPQPGILLPDHWCCFGGGIEPGESVEDAVRRELREELDYAPPSVTEFSDWRVVLPSPHRLRLRFTYCVIPFEESQVPALKLKEGSGMALFLAAVLAAEPKVAPWDLAAVLTHARQAILFPPTSPA